MEHLAPLVPQVLAVLPTVVAGHVFESVQLRHDSRQTYRKTS
jgi:hypothetical protein